MIITVIIIAIQYGKTNVDRVAEGKNNYKNWNCDKTVKNSVIIGELLVSHHYLKISKGEENSYKSI